MTFTLLPPSAWAPRASAVLALAMLLSGCASVAPPSAIPDAVQRHAGRIAASAPLPARDWWRDLGDEAIDALVPRAMAHNHDLHAALATLRQARALAGLAAREALPQGGLQAQAQVTRPSLAEVDPYRQGLPRPPEQRLGSLGQALSWELDLFGRIGTASAVAERQADAAQADAHAAAALLQAEVVRRVVLLRQHQHDAARLAEERSLAERRVQQLALRERAGLADRREVLAAQAQQAEAEALLAATQAGERQQRQALAVLLGRSPAAADAGTAGTADAAEWQALLASRALPGLPAAPFVADPGALLAQRPDVRRADAQLRAVLGDAVLAERAHLPRLRLDLTAALSAPLGALGDAGALRYAAGPVLQWDWLDAGRHRARAAAARAGGEAAWHRFEQVVLQALADTDAALRQQQAARTGWQQAQAAEAAAAQAAAHTGARVQAGLEPPVQALEQSARHAQARRAAQARQAEALLAHVQVQLALAAWQPGPADALQAAPRP